VASPRRWSMHGAGGTDMKIGKRKQVGGWRWYAGRGALYLMNRTAVTCCRPSIPNSINNGVPASCPASFSPAEQTTPLFSPTVSLFSTPRLPAREDAFVSLAECISSLDGNQERGLVMGGDLCTDEKEGRGCRCECWVLGAGLGMEGRQSCR